MLLVLVVAGGIYFSNAADRDRVMVNGEWLVTDGRHHAQDEAGTAYAEFVRSLDLEGVVQ